MHGVHCMCTGTGGSNSGLATAATNDTPEKGNKPTMDGRYQTTNDTSPHTPSPSTFQPHFNRRSFPLNTQDTTPTLINPQMSNTRHTRCQSEHNSNVTSLISPTHTCKNIKRATSTPQPSCITVATQNAARLLHGTIEG